MIYFAIAALYFGFAVFDGLSILARVGASLSGHNAMGGSIEKMTSTCKRIFLFGYPPLLGYLIYSKDSEGIYISIFTSFMAASVATGIIFAFRFSIISIFLSFASSLSRNHSLTRALRSYWSEDSVDSIFIRQKIVDTFTSDGPQIPKSLIPFSVLVYSAYGGSIFLLNLFVLQYAEYAPVILQMIGLINGVGTIFLSFFIDPILSRSLDSKKNLDAIIRTIFTAQIITYVLVSPSIFGVFLMLGVGL